MTEERASVEESVEVARSGGILIEAREAIIALAANNDRLSEIVTKLKNIEKLVELRAGQLQKAIELLNAVPSDYSSLWEHKLRDFFREIGIERRR